MKKPILTLLLSYILFLLFAPKLWAQALVCEEANGLLWCYNPQECGQACDEVCALGGMHQVVDNEVWFEAQNTIEKCQAISQAFGLGDNIKLDGYTFACLEDQDTPNHGSGLNAPLSCSTDERCPEFHRTSMDEQGNTCNGGEFARRSICPCERLNINRPIPTISEWGLIALAAVLGLVGFIVQRRRIVAA